MNRPDKKQLAQIRRTSWYAQFLCRAYQLRKQGFTYKQVKVSLEQTYDILNSNRAFRYQRIAVSAATSLEQALKDCKAGRNT